MTMITTRTTSRTKAAALAAAEVALNRYQAPHNLHAEIAGLLVKPDLDFLDLNLLSHMASENYWHLCADHRVRGPENHAQIVRLNLFSAALGAVLGGADAKTELRRLRAALA